MVIIMKTYDDLILEAEKTVCASFADIPFVQIENIQLKPATTFGKPDIIARLRLPTGEITLVLVVKFNGQPRIAREAVMQIERMVRDIPNAYGIFVAPYISSNAAEIFIQKNIGYMDFAGNSRLSIWPVYIKTTGEKNPFVKKRELRSLYSSKSIKTTMILRVLLENPQRVWKTQELVEAAATSLGQVASVKKQLEDREWMRTDTAGFRLTNAVALLSDWGNNYDFSSNKVRDFYSMKSIPEIESELAEVCASDEIKYALTGIAGGARYAPVVRYQRTTAYIADDYVDKLAEAIGLKEVTTGPNIRLIKPDDQNVFYGSRLVKGACVASPIQLYLDIRNTPGRGEEAAEALLRKEIEPKWR